MDVAHATRPRATSAPPCPPAAGRTALPAAAPTPSAPRPTTGDALEGLLSRAVLARVTKRQRRQAQAALAELQNGTSVPSVADWRLMKSALSGADYRKAVKALDAWTGAKRVRRRFLEQLPSADYDLFVSQLARPGGRRSSPLADRVRGSDNEARAETALTELDARRTRSAKSRVRLPERLVELLVWGVAEARDATDDLGGEGILGIDDAQNAADALVTMKKERWLTIVLKLAVSGGASRGWRQRLVESALILKAIAARKGALADAGKSARAVKTVREFADDIRGEDAATLVEQTSLRDLGGATGLQQKFTMSCGPTSIQILHGEADPVYALTVSQRSKHDLRYENKVAKEQKDLLGRPVAPRTLDPRLAAFNRKLRSTQLKIFRRDLAAWREVAKWLGGVPTDNTRLQRGLQLAAAAGFTRAELDDIKKYYIGLTTEPGLSVTAFGTALAGSRLSDATNAPTRLHRFTKDRPIKKRDLNKMWNFLFRGHDVIIGVMWTGGGGHYMVLTDARGTRALDAYDKEFLLSDPWRGTSEWLTGRRLAGGDFGDRSSGRIDDAYYP